ncbi:C13 family peptidase [Paucibacter sp. Y2R2-4]|uniref:C13 family peptidase n=1 Tax=Paucibacter sp. Y2R2-4 TaxID=2893553 RepID=UPI0021E4B2EF|nr:C13 family peptidase [Paucibacter sp. Y2R2-4]MCV2351311.1 C13 family peptidase [Paucibacter sp. Y2R2-4]
MLVWLSGCSSFILGEAEGTGAHRLSAQLQRLQSDPSPLSETRYIFIGAALNDRQNVFDADIRLLDQQFAAAYGKAYRSVLLSNRRITEGPRDLPLASIDQMDEVFEFWAEHKRANDRFIVLLSSHGAPGILEVSQQPLYRNARWLSSKKLESWMGALEPNRSWLMISACFSGSHLDRLHQDHLLVMTASSAKTPSFGCANSQTNTWFVSELSQALKAPQSFGALWDSTYANIAKREKQMKLPGSMPQLRIGSEHKEGLNEDWSRF